MIGFGLEVAVYTRVNPLVFLAPHRRDAINHKTITVEVSMPLVLTRLLASQLGALYPCRSIPLPVVCSKFQRNCTPAGIRIAAKRSPLPPKTAEPPNQLRRARCSRRDSFNINLSPKVLLTPQCHSLARIPPLTTFVEGLPTGV